MEAPQKIQYQYIGVAGVHRVIDRIPEECPSVRISKIIENAIGHIIMYLININKTICNFRLLLSVPRGRKWSSAGSRPAPRFVFAIASQPLGADFSNSAYVFSSAGEFFSICHSDIFTNQWSHMNKSHFKLARTITSEALHDFSWNLVYWCLIWISRSD